MFATSEGGLWRMAGKARTKVWAIFEEKTHAPAHFCSVPSSFWPLGDFDNPIYSFPNLPSGHQTWHSYGKGFVEYFIPIILMVVFHSNLFDYQRIHVHFEITRVCIKYNKYSYRNCIQALWRLWTCYRSKNQLHPRVSITQPRHCLRRSARVFGRCHEGLETIFYQDSMGVNGILTRNNGLISDKTNWWRGV
jgi:hypothetical protein